MSITIIGVLSVNSFASSTLTYTFSENILYDSDNVMYNDSFNMRAQESYTGHYNATHSFENEVIGAIDLEIAFFSYKSGTIGGNISVVSEYEGHNKVLRYYKDSTANLYTLYNYYEHQTEGIIEFWWLTNDINANQILQIGETPAESIYIRFDAGGNIKYYDGVWNNLLIGYEIDTWYHIKLEFNLTTGDPATNWWNCWINGIEYGVFVDGFYGNPTHFGTFTMYGYSAAHDYSYYIDAVGYSWDSFYNISDNIIPLVEVNDSIQEVNKFEFSLQAMGILNPIGSIPYIWGFNYGANDLVNIVHDYLETGTDRKVEIYGDKDVPHPNGLKRDFSENGSLIQLTYSLNFTEFDNVAGRFTVNITSLDDTLVLKLRILDDVSGYEILQYYDGSGYVELRDDIVIDELYEFNLFIDYNSDTCYLTIINDTTIDNFLFPLIVSDKIGLGTVQLFTYTVFTTSDIVAYIDYIEIYVDGISLSDEFSYLILDFGTKLWNQDLLNIVEIIANGYFAMHCVEGDYELGDNLDLIRGIFTYNGDLFRYNLIDYDFEFYGGMVDNATIVIYSKDEVEISVLSIVGVNLIEGENIYSATYESSSISWNESYFWVDSDNRLQFSLTVDDNDTEYIQASFNINDLPSENRSVFFRSNINGEAKGFLFMDYSDDTSVSLEFPYYTASTSAILIQTKVIDKFTIIITDNDLDDNDVCSGYITDMELIYNPDIHITITTLTLLAVIVPLIVMVVPSVAMKKKFGVMGVMATFILMSVVCVVTSLIPVWLFFVIILGLLGFLVMKKRMEGDS